MNFKRIDLLGFKSFCDKTEILFEPGITAIVGPNGCGKSNICDAIRWVLGEQSFKTLRGTKMEDVIFNGSESRKPMGMAEVSITMKNTNGGFPSQFSEYNEILVTRRLFRSGESEYFINKAACRLKDIREFFMDTGIGSKTYSIIGQGRVDMIVNSKPLDRRFLIEEVAGIMKYKERKTAALNKLEATKQNLLRIGDIIGEVKRQINSLNRQAKTADRYKKYAEEMKTLELQLTSIDYKQYINQWHIMETDYQQLINEETESSVKLAKNESDVEEMKLHLLDKEKETAKIQKDIYEIDNSINKLENQTEFNKNQAKYYQERCEKITSELKQLEEELKMFQGRIESHQKEKEEYKQEISQVGEDLSKKESEYEELSGKLKDKEKLIEDGKVDIINILTQITQDRNNISHLLSKETEIAYSCEKLQKEKEETQKKQETIQNQHLCEKEKLEQILLNSSNLEKELIKTNKSIEDSKKTLESEGEELVEIKEKLSSHVSRLNSLLEMQENLEDYQEGVRSIIFYNREKSDFKKGIHGIVSEIIDVQPKFEMAIEAVLGEKLQHIIVETHQNSKEAIEYLKHKDGGRSTFIPLQLKKTNNGQSEAVKRQGVIGNAISFVKINNDYADIINHLLSEVLIVENLDAALSLWNGNNLHKTLVTLDGDVVDPWGVITGGSSNKLSTGILKKKREIKELTQSVDDLKKLIKDVERKREKNISALASLEHQKHNIEENLHQTRINFAHQEKDINQLEIEMQRIEQKLNTIAMEEEQLKLELERIKKAIEEKQEKLTELSALKEEREKAILQLQNSFGDMVANVNHIRNEVTELKVKNTALIEKNESIKSNLQRAEETYNQILVKIVKEKDEHNEIKDKIALLLESIKKDELSLMDLIKSKEEIKKLLIEKEDALREKNETLSQTEQLLKANKKKLDDLQKNINELRIKRTELNLQMEHIKTIVREKFNLSIDNLLNNQEKIDDTENWVTTAKERLYKLKEEVERIGPVNLAAIEEYNSLTERYDFLKKQQEDLTESMVSLQKAIARINKSTKSRFINAFNAINDKLKDVFPQLFGGGQAKLIMTDENNILETGVDIMVHIPGKKLQNISLLSGGEKALTAISLLFSIFLVKPSPFCFLDEVDAPLDDSNNNRFIQMLNSSAHTSQFIIITHNKKTMEAANTLCGITMEEPGVSKIISVQMN